MRGSRVVQSGAFGSSQKEEGSRRAICSNETSQSRRPTKSGHPASLAEEVATTARLLQPSSPHSNGSALTTTSTRRESKRAQMFLTTSSTSTIVNFDMDTSATSARLSSKNGHHGLNETVYGNEARPTGLPMTLCPRGNRCVWLNANRRRHQQRPVRLSAAIYVPRKARPRATTKRRPGLSM